MYCELQNFDMIFSFGELGELKKIHVSLIRQLEISCLYMYSFYWLYSKYLLNHLASKSNLPSYQRFVVYSSQALLCVKYLAMLAHIKQTMNLIVLKNLLNKFIANLLGRWLQGGSKLSVAY